jgi:NodT family efflux transporter outer membrane factor (OMF) lipoprotein
MKRFIYLLLVIIYLVSCKNQSTLTNKTLKQLPKQYNAANTDSLSTGEISWRAYFTDEPLVALIDTALKNNPDMLIAMQRMQMAEAEVQFNKGLLFPTVDGAANVSQRKFGYHTMDDAGNRTTEITPGQMIPTHLPDFFLGFRTTWELDVWGKLRNRKKAAVARYLSSIEGKNFVISTLVADVANLYYNLMAMDNELIIIRETIKLQQNALEIAKIQKDAGATNLLAVQQFEAQVLNTRAMELEIMQNIIETENLLNFLLGRFPQTIPRNSTVYNDSIQLTIRSGVPSALLKNRPDVKQAELELIAAGADVKAAKAAFYPSFTIDGTFGIQAFRPQLLFNTPGSIAYGFFGNLFAPLINRSAIKAEFKMANAIQLEALYNYQKSILNGFSEVNSLLANIQALDKIQQFKTKETSLLNTAIETSGELFKTGNANYLEILITQQNALQSKLELVNIKRRMYNASVNIYKALGGGWK